MNTMNVSRSPRSTRTPRGIARHETTPSAPFATFMTGSKITITRSDRPFAPGIEMAASRGSAHELLAQVDAFRDLSSSLAVD